jgi:Ser/Thr protein kinase RdoA (MazF antagonist)
LDNLVFVAQKFKHMEKVIDVLTLESKGGKHFILQRINTQVFRKPELIMLNMRIVTEYVCRLLQHSHLREGRYWKVPLVLLTQDGKDHFIDYDGSFWRAISFIEDSQSFETIKSIGQAREVGYALGMFHSLLRDLPPGRLADTLEGFHNTLRYLKHYNEVLAKHDPCRSPEERYCLGFVSKRSAWAKVLENARVEGKLHLRIIHGDPKVNNIMMDISTGQAVSIVDLDTVKSGLVHYDIGDCLRSGCNPLREETEKWESVNFEVDLCRAILEGYLSMASVFLTENDYDYLYDAIRLIAFELGLRYLTDYLEGNVYFNAIDPEQNLLRALVQFKLTESIESQATAIHTIIREIR